MTDTPPKKPPVSDGSPNQSSYVRADDGKRVRRIKRWQKKKKSIESQSPATITTMDYDMFTKMQQSNGTTDHMLDFILVGGILNEKDSTSTDTFDELGGRSSSMTQKDSRDTTCDELSRSNDSSEDTLPKSNRANEKKKNTNEPGGLTGTPKAENAIMEPKRQVESLLWSAQTTTVTSLTTTNNDPIQTTPKNEADFSKTSRATENKKEETPNVSLCDATAPNAWDVSTSNNRGGKTSTTLAKVEDFSKTSQAAENEEKETPNATVLDATTQKAVGASTSNNHEQEDFSRTSRAAEREQKETPNANVLDATTQKAVGALTSNNREKATPRQVEDFSRTSRAAEKEKKEMPNANVLDATTQKVVGASTSNNPTKAHEFELRRATEKKNTKNPYADLIDAAQKAVDALSLPTTPKQVEKVSAPTMEKETTCNPWLVEPGDLLDQEEILPVGDDTAQVQGSGNPVEDFVVVNAIEMTSPPAPSNLAQKNPDPANPLHTNPAQEGSMTPPAASSPETSPLPDRYTPSRASSRTISPMLDQYLPRPATETTWQELTETPKTQGRDDPVFDNAVEKIAAAAISALQQGNAENASPPVAQLSAGNAENASPPVAELSADTSDYGSLQELPSTDAVKQNWEKEVWQPKERVPTPKRRALPEFFGERTRSCATVDSHIPLTPAPVERKRGPSHVISPLNNDGDYDAYILQTVYAQKRVKVVQLLIFGLLGLAFGFLASFYVQSSCHFLTAHEQVGNSGEFDLHYGMWKYTPLSSVFKGYSFCYKYDSRYSNSAPHIPRIVGLVALLCGVYSLGVLWVYLVLGKTTYGHWNRAIYSSLVAGVFQALTMLFFAGQVCRQNTCSVGPGAAVSIVSTLTWFVLAFEMYYNSPLADHLSNTVKNVLSSEEDSIVASLEMSDVEHGVAAFFRRLQPRQEPITLNQYRRDPPRASGRASPQRALTPNRALSTRGLSPGRLGRGRQPSPARKDFVYEPPVFEAA